ncbi:MAG: hypothetical protein KGI54_08870 [Pseudomonadota bacterium]|nr:hypothetical protein [Pseudomonadota bacterium]
MENSGSADKKFYVYELVSDDGEIHYVGKGSKNRLKVQQRKFGLNGTVVKYFATESKAYAFEKLHIAAVSPKLNKCAGGNGNKSTRTVVRKTEFQKLYEKIGSKAMAARIWLNFANDISVLEKIRRVAYG